MLVVKLMRFVIIFCLVEEDFLLIVYVSLNVFLYSDTDTDRGALPKLAEDFNFRLSGQFTGIFKSTCVGVKFLFKEGLHQSHTHTHKVGEKLFFLSLAAV